MKKEIKLPPKKLNTQQAILNTLMLNGLSPTGAEKFIHVNMPSLGGYRSIQNLIDDGDWDLAWATVESYLEGNFS